MTFVMTFHGWVLALCANILVFSLVPFMPCPRKTAAGFMPDVGRALVRLAWVALAAFLTPTIWLVWALLK